MVVRVADAVGAGRQGVRLVQLVGAHAGEPHGKQACKPTVSVVLKGTLANDPVAGATSLMMSVTGSNAHGKSLKGLGVTIALDGKTTVRRQGAKFLKHMERAQRLEDAYKSILSLPESPYGRVFRQGVNFFSELRPGALRENAPPTPGLSLTQLEYNAMLVGISNADASHVEERFSDTRECPGWRDE